MPAAADTLPQSLAKRFGAQDFISIAEPKDDSSPSVRLAQGTTSVIGNRVAIEANVSFHYRHDEGIGFDNEVISGRSEWNKDSLDRKRDCDGVKIDPSRCESEPAACQSMCEAREADESPHDPGAHHSLDIAGESDPVFRHSRLIQSP
ncbi:MAG TPA: hypothetical protein VHK05_07005 [Candidatus Limnocylindrales bacterium]|nr:hypothetical protein [Candidatus Limnocylindrales bacterium]